jgi:hypothetical protein
MIRPTELWIVRYRVGPEVWGWSARAWDAEDALERFLDEPGFTHEDEVVSVRRAKVRDN